MKPALGTHFLVRTCVDRLAGDGEHTIAAEMNEEEISGLHEVEVRDAKGKPETVAVEIKYRRMHVLPPIGKQKRYPALTVLYAQEREEPKHRPRIDWKLITNLPVHSHDDAIEKLDWYAMRWKIETFHKILKSGCKAQEARLRTAERLVKLIAVFCILAWRVFWMTMINRSQPHAKPDLAITDVEMKLLDHLLPDKDPTASHAGTLSSYLVKIAQLSGYLARASDPPPGNTVMWRGLTRLTDIKLGATIGAELMDN
ncbi:MULTISPECIES: IS4 family transposase [unclassified Mesorhizobium]|uniref:IS4 family transposase n=1 Tax=unclassified Mesorhizobium TaxID=325217 RepID=UPI001FE01B01|nr:MULTISPECIES: IS4 family transposase [unclassified Mesorhizobium]